MKRLSIISLILLLSPQLFAQDSLRISDKTKAKINSVVQRDDKLIITFSSDNWSGLPSTIKAKPIRSRGFSFLFMNERMNRTGNIGLGIGLGFMSQNVHTDAFLADTTSNGSATSLIKIPDSLNYKVNKLSLNFITAALEIRLRSNENNAGKRFKLSIGMIAGYLIQSHTKYEDKAGKNKGYDIDHLNKFQYGPEFRIGYSKVAVSGYYSLVDVFEKGKGPELIPYSVGISFGF